MNIDWSKAPAEATHFDSIAKLFCNKDGWWTRYSEFRPGENVAWGNKRYIPRPDTMTPEEEAMKAEEWKAPHIEPDPLDEMQAITEIDYHVNVESQSKYHVYIKGAWIDVYDILMAYGVTNPADQHAIKKMLMPGKRGHKDAIKDREEAILSLKRAIELEKGNEISL